MAAKVAYELKDGTNGVYINVQESDETLHFTSDRTQPIEAEKGSTLAAALADSPGLKVAETKSKAKGGDS